MLPTFDLPTLSGFPNLPLTNFAALTPADWARHIEEAVQEATRVVQVIVNLPEGPTFDNVVVALEQRERALTEVVGPFRCAQGAHNTPEMEAVAQEWLPKLDVLDTELYQNSELYQRFSAAIEGQAWDEDEQRLIDDYLLAFRLAGVHLPASEQEELKALSKRLSELSVEFQAACQKDASETIVFDDASALDGVEEGVVTEARTAAVAMGKPEAMAVTLDGSTVASILSQARNRETRRVIYLANMQRGMGVRGTDTQPLIVETLALRQRNAELLEYANWAELAIAKKMAKTPQAAETLLFNTWKALTPARDSQLAQLAERAALDGVEGELQAWDVEYYLERIRSEQFDLDENLLRSYFPISAVRQGAFDAAERLFGVRFELLDVKAWHEDTQVYQVWDMEVPVGLIVIDDYIRDTKAPGAWMDTLQEQDRLDNDERLPMVINVCNVAKPDDGSEALLTYDDVVTTFHELGHGLHGLLSAVRFPSQAGANVDRDFVELPSQLFENWARHPEGLAQFARHFKTGEKMPQELVDKIRDALRFGQALTQSRYLLSAVVDLRLHQQSEPVDPMAFSAAVVAEMDAGHALTPRHELTHFSHLFAGDYSAGYYSYLWAEVLEADTFTPFAQSENGIFDAALGQKLRQCIYEKGDSRDAAALFKDFRGQDPDITAVLRKWGAEPAKPRLKVA